MKYLKANWKNIVIVVLMLAVVYLLTADYQTRRVINIIRQNSDHAALKLNTERFLNGQPQQTRAIFRQLGFNVSAAAPDSSLAK